MSKEDGNNNLAALGIAMGAINPRPGVVVAITDRCGEIACYDPNAYRRRDFLRNEKIRQESEEEDKHE